MENFSLEEYNALKASGVKFNFSEENVTFVLLLPQKI
jgi:hypothetical protein